MLELVQGFRELHATVNDLNEHGILTRVERILVIGPSILFGIPLIGAAIVAVGANITAIQRVIDVRRQAQSQKIEQSQTSEE